MSDPIPNENIDKILLKRAMNAFKRRLKMSRLGDESGTSRGAFSGGKVSGIAGINPPREFPKEVWEKLVEQGRLVEMNSLYSLPLQK
jgi:hypothetical protein